MSFTFQAEQWLPYPIEPVFAFFASPENLPRLMPPWQHTRLEDLSLAPQGAAEPGMAGVGSRITISFRPFPGSPLRLRWMAEISSFVRNSYFMDAQVSGPFAFWEHTHRFRSTLGAGLDGTFVVDTVRYTPPMGVLGSLANSLVLRRQLRSTFLYRQQRAAELIASLVPQRSASARPSASTPAPADARAAS